MFHTFQISEGKGDGDGDGETKTNNNTPRDILQTLPTFMQRQILAFFGYKDHTLAGRTSPQLYALWKEARERMARDGVRVPEDCRTLKAAVKLVESDDRLTTIVLGKGEHVVDVLKDEDGDDSNTLEIPSAMNIVGDPRVSRKDIVIVGGIYFREGIPGTCHLQHLTLRQAKGHGVVAQSSFTMEDVLVEQCGGHGVVANGTGVVGRCTNVEVRQCGGNGVLALNQDMRRCRGNGVPALNDASITLIGANTTVHDNCTRGSRFEYGLAVYNSPSSTIQLVSPLTKEQVSVNNGGAGNWGAELAEINQIKTISQAEFTALLEKEASSEARVQAASQKIKVTGTVNVPEDCGLSEAVRAASFRGALYDRVPTIVVGKGEHQIDAQYLNIYSATNIVGDPEVPKEEIVVVGGIGIKKGIQGNCRLQHLTLRQARDHGVLGYSSFTMDDVLVEQCCDHGVVADGTGVVGRCTNVEVRQCRGNGVLVSNGASITLIGANTTVHDNCTRGYYVQYGLTVHHSSSTIQLVSPLTKEQVSVNNGGGGNWGAWRAEINQIKTITPADDEANLAR